MPHDAGGLVLSTKASRIELLTWVLIYGGLLLACLGLFMQRADAELGWTLIAAGLALSALGVALIVVRARMGPPAP